MLNKVVSIIYLIAAWLLAGFGIYGVFMKGQNVSSFLVLIVGAMTVIFAERHFRRVFSN